MRFTRSPKVLLALPCSLVLLLAAAGPGHGQRPKRLKYVDVAVIAPDKRVWEMVGVKDNSFLLRRSHDGRYQYLKNFNQSADWAAVNDSNLAYDLEGKSKDVLPQRRYDENTRWEKKGVRRLQARLRVKNGELKGWWIGLEVVKEKAEPGKPALARLVLVEDEKDAVILRWDDPLDISP